MRRPAELDACGKIERRREGRNRKRERATDLLLGLERLSSQRTVLAGCEEELAHAVDGGSLLLVVEVREVDLDGGVLRDVEGPGDERGGLVQERPRRLDRLETLDTGGVGRRQALVVTSEEVLDESLRC